MPERPEPHTRGATTTRSRMGPADLLREILCRLALNQWSIRSYGRVREDSLGSSRIYRKLGRSLGQRGFRASHPHDVGNVLRGRLGPKANPWSRGAPGVDATVRGVRAADAGDWTTDEARGAQGPRDGQAAADRGIRSASNPMRGPTPSARFTRAEGSPSRAGHPTPSDTRDGAGGGPDPSGSAG